MKEQEQNFTSADVMILMSRFGILNDKNRKYTIDRYRNLEQETVTNRRHQMIVDEATKWTIKVMARGGREEELRKMLEYLGVCIDAKEHQLNYKECYNDLEIEKILEKYNAKEKTEE